MTLLFLATVYHITLLISFRRESYDFVVFLPLTVYHITLLISFRRESDDFVVCLPLISISGLILYFGTQEYV